MNNEQANQLVLVVSFPLLVRGHAIQTKVYDDIITMRVPNLYRLTLGLPCSVFENSTHSYYDCKIRKLFITMPVRRITEVVDDLLPLEEKISQPSQAEEVKVSSESAPQGQSQSKQEVTQTSNSEDLFFDVM